MKLHIALATALGFLGITAYPAIAADTLRLGFLSSLSGPVASLGAEQRRGIDLALEDLGGKLGSMSVEVITGDDQGDAQAAVDAASKLIDKDKVDLITGIIASPALVGAAKSLEDSGLIVVSANAGPSLFAGKDCQKNFFFTGFQNDQGDEAIGLYFNEHNFKNVYFMGFDNQAGHDHINGAKRTYKGTIAGEIYTPLSQLDYSSEIAQVRAAKPDAVYAFYVAAPAVAFVKQYSQAGMSNTPLFSYALVDPMSAKAQGAAAFGVHVAGPYFASIDNPQNKAFVAAFEKKYGRQPGFVAADQYDAIMLIDSALRATGGKPHDLNAMRAALMKADFKAVRGGFRFNVNHFPIQDYYIAAAVKGEPGGIDFKIDGVERNQKDSYYQACKMAE